MHIGIGAFSDVLPCATLGGLRPHLAACRVALEAEHTLKSADPAPRSEHRPALAALMISSRSARSPTDQGLTIGVSGTF